MNHQSSVPWLLAPNKLTVVTVTHKGCHGPSRVKSALERSFRVFRVRELAGRSGSSSKTPPLREERFLFPSCPRHHHLRSRRHDLVECDSQLTFHSLTRLPATSVTRSARLAQSVERKALIALGESHLVVGGSSPPSGVRADTHGEWFSGKIQRCHR